MLLSFALVDEQPIVVLALPVKNKQSIGAKYCNTSLYVDEAAQGHNE